MLKRLGRLMERCLSSVEGSLEKFYQVTHFPRAESWIEIYIYIYSEVIFRNLGLIVFSGIW